MTDAVGHWLNAAGRVPLLSAAEEVHLNQAIRRWQDWEGGPEGFLPKSARQPCFSLNLCQ